MATVIQRICDMEASHGEAREQRVALNGREVSIDLCEPCAASLRAALSMTLDKGRKVRAGVVATPHRTNDTSHSPTTDCPVCNEPKRNQGLAPHVQGHVRRGEWTEAKWEAWKRKTGWGLAGEGTAA